MTIEPEAVEAARAGGDALEALIVRLWPEAYRVAFGIVRDRALAEDAAQEACATIALRLRSLKSATAFGAWSYKIIASRALDAVRNRPLETDLDEADRAQPPVERGDALDLYEALGSLEPRQRAVSLLHYYGGLNSVEIGSAIGIAPVTVRFHLMRARAALRKALAVTEVAQSLEEAISHVR
jgi:RNA polymerase sigma-70 factor (ECF subfamily)